jgi:phage shock protein C
MTHALLRPQRGKVIAGVCAALADRFGVSRALVRIAFVLFGIFGVGEIVYIALWIVIPKSSDA